MTAPRDRDPARLRALVVLVAIVVVGAVSVLLILRADSSKSPPRGAAPTCGPTATPTAMARAAIRIRVLNATSRPGLAGTVAAELRRRGYTVTGVGNDTTAVRGPAEMRYGAAGAAAAKAVAGLVAGAVSRQVTRSGSDIDLVLGNGFTQLRAAGPAPAKPGAGCPATATPKQ